MTDADTYTYPYQMPTDQPLVERNDDSAYDGLVGADEENIRMDDYERETHCTNSERCVGVVYCITSCVSSWCSGCVGTVW